METAKSNRRWAIVLGIGLALFPIHNLWLTEVTSIKNQATLFLPAIGAVIWMLVPLLYLVKRWEKLDLGDKKIYIPLIIISLSMGISGFINGEGLYDKFSPLFMGIVLIFVYIVSRKLGSDIFLALIPLVIIGASVSIIIGLINPGFSGGGLITNYCASAGYLIFGALVNQGRLQWALLIIALIGVFFIGALEAVFILGILGITLLIRRDFSKKFYILFGVGVGLVGLWALLGYLTPLYQGNYNIQALIELIKGNITLNGETLRMLTTGRWEIIVGALKNTTIFGHGYSLSTTEGQIVHNIPLIISHQIGPLAAITWLFLTVYCAFKTKWKYAWIGLMAMCVFDHYIWTQFTPYWWVLIGVSTTSDIKNDLIFRRNK